jgi:hypothetical protein
MLRLVVRCFAATSVLALLVGCADRFTGPDTLTKIAPGMTSIEVVESDGFYRDPADNMYFWDFTEPEGDATFPPEIGSVEPYVQVPRPGTEGWVGVKFFWAKGDVGRAVLTHDAFRETGEPFYSNREHDSGWKLGKFTLAQGCQRNCTEFMNYWENLSTGEACGIGITLNGHVKAAYGVPFGLSISLFKPSISVGFGWTTWREQERTFPEITRAAYACDTQEDLSCDDENTTEIEYCPVPGNPNTPPQTRGGTSHEIRDIEEPEPGGATREYCEWTHYWVSTDGGQTWTYSYSEFNGCHDIE